MSFSTLVEKWAIEVQKCRVKRIETWDLTVLVKDIWVLLATSRSFGVHFSRWHVSPKQQVA